MPVDSDHPSFQSPSPPPNRPGFLPASPHFGSQLQDDLDLGQLLKVAQRRKWVVAGVAVVVTSAIWVWTLTRTSIYQGGFQVLVESATEGDRSQQLLQEEQLQLTAQFDYATQIEVLRSPALLDPVLRSLQDEYPNLSYGQLSANLSIARLRDTKVLAVNYRDPDPELIDAVLAELADSYLAYSYDQRQQSLQQGVQFVEDQLPELRERVTTLQVRLERFRQQYSLIDPESRGGEISALISAVEQQRQEAQTQLTEAQSLYTTLQRQIGYDPREALAASSLSESSRYQDLLNQIRAVEAKIAVELTRFQPGTPNIQVLEDERNNLLPLLEAEAQRVLGDRLSGGAVNGNLTPIALELSRQLVNTANQVQVLQSRNQALAQVERQLKQEFALVPALARQYTDLQRELTIATESLNRFLATRETLQIDAAQKSVPWELISAPSVAQAPISPNIPRNLMLGAIAGVLFGSAAALLVEKLDTAFHSADDLKAFTKRPILGVIPYERELQQKSIDAAAEVEAASQGLEPTAIGLHNGTAASHVASSAHHTYHATPFLEAFRSLHANIRFLSSDHPIQSVVISSAAPGEGKSTTSVHLAKAAAAMGQRVLLVDADLRLPQVHQRLNLPNLRGLSNLLNQDFRLSQVMQRSPTEPDLYVLTAGAIPPDPVKLLSSQRMQSLMKKFQQDFDFIIYDTPPLLGFADSTLLGVHTNGMILVAGLGRTTRQDMSQALDALKISPIPILGVVANGIKSYTTKSYGYERYRRYYTQSTSSAAQQKDPKPSWLNLDSFQRSPRSPASTPPPDSNNVNGL